MRTSYKVNIDIDLMKCYYQCHPGLQLDINQNRRVTFNVTSMSSSGQIEIEHVLIMTYVDV